MGPLVISPFAMGKTKQHRTSKMGWPVDRSTTKPISPSSYKLNTQFGFNVISGSSVNSGFQLGRLVYSRFPIYLGPELSFMLFSPGSILNVLVGGWVENHLFSDHRKTTSVFMGAWGFLIKDPPGKPRIPFCCWIFPILSRLMIFLLFGDKFVLFLLMARCFVR